MNQISSLYRLLPLRMQYAGHLNWANIAHVQDELDTELLSVIMTLSADPTVTVIIGASLGPG